MSIRGKILVLENRRIEFEKYEEALAAVNIECHVVTDTDDFLDLLTNTLPHNLEQSWDYAGTSLDLKIKVPNRGNAESLANGGAWFLKEVLRHDSVDNSFLKPEQAAFASSIPLSVLTNFERDEELIHLQKSYEQDGKGFPIISKGSPVNEYVAWAERAVDEHLLSFQFSDDYRLIKERYYDACLTVIRLCQTFDFVTNEIYQILGMPSQTASEMDVCGDLANYILDKYPPESVIAPSVLSDRWEVITQLLADTVAVYNGDTTSARKDLDSSLGTFEGRSALQIIKKGSNVDIISLLAYQEQRWGRDYENNW